MKNKLVLLLTSLSVFSPATFAEGIEKWICKDAQNYTWATIVEAEVYESRESGNIKVAGIVYEAQFQVKGFNRRWDFVLQDERV